MHAVGEDSICMCASLCVYMWSGGGGSRGMCMRSPMPSTSIAPDVVLGPCGKTWEGVVSEQAALHVPLTLALALSGQLLQSPRRRCQPRPCFCSAPTCTAARARTPPTPVTAYRRARATALARCAAAVPWATQRCSGHPPVCPTWSAMAGRYGNERLLSRPPPTCTDPSVLEHDNTSETLTAVVCCSWFRGR